MVGGAPLGGGGVAPIDRFDLDTRGSGSYRLSRGRMGTFPHCGPPSTDSSSAASHLAEVHEIVPREQDRRPASALVTGAASGIGAACCDPLSRRGLDGPSAGTCGPGADQRVAIDRRRLRLGRGRGGGRGRAAARCRRQLRGDRAAAPIIEMSRDDWDRTLAINLNGAFYVCPAPVPSPRRARRRARPGRVGQREEHDALPLAVQRLEGGPRLADAGAGRGVGARRLQGIRVFAVSPGITRTPQPMLRIETGAITEEKLLDRVPDAPLDRAPRRSPRAIFGLVGGDFRRSTART